MSLKIYQRGRNADGSRSDELTDITALCGGITLEGAVKSASRKLTFQTLREKQDYYLSRHATIRRGDAIALDDGSENYIFYGVVWRVEASDNSLIQSVTCYDNMKYLMASETITNTWVDVTPQEVTKQVCKELGVTCGSLPETKDIKVTVNAREKSGYEAIMIAWTEAHKANMKVYYPRMVGYKLTVIEKGEKLDNHALRHYSQDLPGSLISVSTTEDTEGAITALYDRGDEGSPATFVEQDKEMVKLYGWIVGMTSNDKNTSSDDVPKLNDGKKTANVSAIGDWAVQTGWSVAVESELFTEKQIYIESDKHMYENGIHTMELELSYENTMDEIANGKNESDESVEGDSVEAQVWNFLRAEGFTAAGAAGVMGNIQVESNFQSNIEEYGGGGGYGLCQWTGSRRTDLMNWCAANNADYTSVEGQLKFMMHEVKTGGYTKVMTMNSVEEACRYWLTDFERAGIPNWEARISAANSFYSRWKNYKKVPSTGGDGKATGNYTWPCPGVACALTTYTGHTHNARDLPIPMNTKIVAMDGGTVEQVQYWDGYTRDPSSMMSYGHTLVVRHSSGKYTRYAHLNKISVANGAKVSKGQQIGLSGTTGNSNGPHLHLEIVENGVGIDPATFFGTYYSG